ncbi:rod shape-determining protein RodA [Desulfocucumis palustris]|uniref:Peptidoglycan glycosyltransferase RodA n=1 Tax=Desulfocucumis palustris TaxID=1898651 RepID=A0A2L2XFV0_9FIRM|nr:rod shape-determining protein RodA [Desulfocucumis palustris]GBF34884.1 rod shape-determining protein RodA [Desulfocucumis palustris]
MIKRIIKNIDYTLAITTLLIIIFSLIVIGSATLEFTDASFTKLKDLNFFVKLLKLDYEYVIRQFVWVLIGIVAMVAVLYIDYEDLGKYTRSLYILNLVMLLAVRFMGETALGAQRWIPIGPFQFQPSEFAKIIIIITFADFLVKREGRLNRFRDLIPCFIFVGIPMLLILAQPDLGTSLVFIAITFGMLFAAGARPALLVGIIGIGLLAGVTLYNVHAYYHSADMVLEERLVEVKKAIGGNSLYVDSDQGVQNDLKKNHLTGSKKDLQTYYDILVKEHEKAHQRHEKFHKYTLKEYQMTRLTIFMDPESDLLGAGYHVWQSRIALGSGGLSGKGLLGGTQSHYTFLPIRHTDFIYSVVGEEFGFIGAVTLLALYFVLLYRGVQIAMMARDTYGSLLAVGVVSKFAFHIMVNIGMTAGVMPVTGIPLPLFSYGGSNMLANLISIGILMNIYVRRQKLIF